MLSRRGFLGAIAAAFVPDPDRALWVRGARRFFIPKHRGLITPDMIATEVILVLRQNLVLYGPIEREFDSAWEGSQPTVINVRKPTRFIGRAAV